MDKRNDRVKVRRPDGGSTFMARQKAETLRQHGWRIEADSLVEVPDLETPAPKRGRPAGSKNQSN